MAVLGGGARRSLRLRSRATPTTGWWPTPLSASARAIGVPWLVDGPRHRVRPPPGLGQEAPAIPDPRSRAAYGATRQSRDHLLGLHGRTRRRGSSVIGRDRVTAIPNGIDPGGPGGCPCRRTGVAACPLREPRRAPRADGRQARLREGLPSGARRARADRRRKRHVRFVVAGTGTAESELKAQARSSGWLGTAHSSVGRVTICCTRSTGWPTSASCRRSTSLLGSSRSRRWPQDASAWSADTGGLREVVPADGTAGLRFPPTMPTRCARPSSACSPTTTSAQPVDRRGTRARAAVRLDRGCPPHARRLSGARSSSARAVLTARRGARSALPRPSPPPTGPHFAADLAVRRCPTAPYAGRRRRSRPPSCRAIH